MVGARYRWVKFIPKITVNAGEWLSFPANAIRPSVAQLSSKPVMMTVYEWFRNYQIFVERRRSVYISSYQHKHLWSRLFDDNWRYFISYKFISLYIFEVGTLPGTRIFFRDSKVLKCKISKCTFYGIKLKLYMVLNGKLIWERL